MSDTLLVPPPTAADYESKTNGTSDRRVRAEAHGYRVVVPDGAQKGKRFFVNNSPVVIEKRGKDAVGQDKWDKVTSFPKPGGLLREAGETDVDYALYWLLAGPDAE